MPPGDERTEAMHKAMVFEMLQSFTNFSGASAAHRPDDGSLGVRPTTRAIYRLHPTNR